MVFINTTSAKIIIIIIIVIIYKEVVGISDKVDLIRVKISTHLSAKCSSNVKSGAQRGKEKEYSSV